MLNLAHKHSKKAKLRASAFGPRFVLPFPLGREFPLATRRDGPLRLFPLATAGFFVIMSVLTASFSFFSISLSF